MSVDLAQLKTELETDPLALGYSVLLSGGAHREVAKLMNTPGTGPTYEIEPAEASAKDLQSAVVVGEFTALTDWQQRLWLAIVSLGEIPIRDANLRGQIGGIWGPGTTTRSNLVALQKREVSRSEVLFGEGQSVSQAQVAEALAL